MWANRNPASEDLNRIVSNRRHKTAVREALAAGSPSPYPKYDQSHLKADLGAISKIWESITGPETREWKRGGHFGSLGHNPDVCEVETWNEGHIGAGDLEDTHPDAFSKKQDNLLKTMQDLRNLRDALVGQYKTKWAEAVREAKVYRENMTTELRMLTRWVNNGEMVLEGEELAQFQTQYSDLIAKQKRHNKLAMDAKANLENAVHGEGGLQELEEAIAKQDEKIHEAAYNAGVGDVRAPSGEGFDWGDATLGGLAAGVGIIYLAMWMSRGQAPSITRGRRGSAYNVFMGQ